MRNFLKIKHALTDLFVFSKKNFCCLKKIKIKKARIINNNFQKNHSIANQIKSFSILLID